MYQQPNHSYASTDSLRRLSSNNPFRQHQQSAQGQKFQAPKLANRSNLSVGSAERHHSFDEWVEKNKQLVDLSSDEDEPFRPVNMNLQYSQSPARHSPTNSGDFSRPVFPPRPVRADSDSSVNYNNVYVF